MAGGFWLSENNKKFLLGIVIFSGYPSEINHFILIS
jgi:hypothetical protein